MFKKICVLLLLISGITGCASQAPSSPLLNYDPQTLRVFSSYPGFNNLPFYAWTEGNQPIGFEPELAQLVAEQMRMKIAFVYPREASREDPRVYSLRANLADAALFSFPATKHTKRLVGLSKPYASDGVSILVASNSAINRGSDLQNKTLLAFKHTSANSWATRRFPNARILDAYPKGSDKDVAELLEDKIIDAFLMGRRHLKWVAKENSNLRVLPEKRSHELFSIAVSKNNPRLLQRVNRALSNLEANGKLRQLRRKWFGSTAK